ncbi:MAG: hypothetical protein U0871_04065 [Gemmataceae bacterium]
MDWHRSVGSELKTMYDRMITLSVDIANTYGKNNRLGRKSLNMTEVLSSVRSELEDRMFQEHGDEGDVTVYYGRRDHAGKGESA